MTDEGWNFVMGVNIYGLCDCLREEMAISAPGGSIVDASSVAGLIGSPFNSLYVISKHAVIGLTRAAAKEVGERRCEHTVSVRNYFLPDFQ